MKRKITDKMRLDFLDTFLDITTKGFRWHVDKSTGMGYTFVGCGGKRSVRQAIDAAMSSASTAEKGGVRK